MPDSTPIRGYPYPLPDDAIADYPALGRSLAEILDGEIQVPPGNAIGDVLTWSGSAWVPVAGIANVSPPTVNQAPTIVGAVNSGATVTRGAGVWAGNPVPVVTWAWLIDNVQVQAGGDTYAIPADATGKTLKLREAASNSFGASSSEVTHGIAVGIKGSWEATRAFLDQASYDWLSIPWASNPDNSGDAVTTPAALVQDQWGIGLQDLILLPAAGTYRFEFSAEFPDNWTQGSSGGLEFVGTRIYIYEKGVFGEVVDTNRNQSRTVDVPGCGAGNSLWMQFKGSAQGKAPRPNNIRLRITHLG